MKIENPTWTHFHKFDPDTQLTNSIKNQTYPVDRIQSKIKFATYPADKIQTLKPKSSTHPVDKFN